MSDIVERLRERMVERDKAVAKCPVNKPNWRGGASSCQKCGAGSGQACSVMAGADYGFVVAARAALATEPTK